MMSFGALKYFESVIKKLKKIIVLYINHVIYICVIRDSVMSSLFIAMHWFIQIKNGWLKIQVSKSCCFCKLYTHYFLFLKPIEHLVWLSF